MFAPIHDLVKDDAAVKAQLGDPVAFYSFGEGPAKGAPRYREPYGVWQVVGGAPENFLAGRPDYDLHVVQVDVYASSPEDARRAVRSLVNAIELQGYVTSWNGEFREPDTKLFRISFTAEFITPR